MADAHVAAAVGVAFGDRDRVVEVVDFIDAKDMAIRVVGVVDGDDAHRHRPIAVLEVMAEIAFLVIVDGVAVDIGGESGACTGR